MQPGVTVSFDTILQEYEGGDELQVAAQKVAVSQQ